MLTDGRDMWTGTYERGTGPGGVMGPLLPLDLPDCNCFKGTLPQRASERDPEAPLAGPQNTLAGPPGGSLSTMTNVAPPCGDRGLNKPSPAHTLDSSLVPSRERIVKKAVFTGVHNGGIGQNRAETPVPGPGRALEGR